MFMEAVVELVPKVVIVLHRRLQPLLRAIVTDLDDVEHLGVINNCGRLINVLRRGGGLGRALLLVLLVARAERSATVFKNTKIRLALDITENIRSTR